MKVHTNINYFDNTIFISLYSKMRKKVARSDKKKYVHISYFAYLTGMGTYTSHFLDLLDNSDLKVTVKISLIVAHELRKQISSHPVRAKMPN